VTSPATLLIVDDEAPNRKLLEALLRPEGYLTLTAASGAEALASIARHPPDLILLDVMMPGLDGFEVCAALREAGIKIPIILLTAKDDVDTRAKGMHEGVSEFLTKPINRTELAARIRAQLHILELNRRLEEVERNLQNRVPAPGATRPPRA